MKEILAYLSQLRDNNNREWFQAHKAEYDRLRPLFVEKVQALIQQIARFDDDIAGLEWDEDNRIQKISCNFCPTCPSMWRI